MIFYFFFFFKQKTAYEMRISDWSSDVCSSDLEDIVASQIVGTAWDGGRAVVAYEFYRRDALAAADRDYVTDDLSAFGGPDLRSNYASPGTILSGGETFAIPQGQDGTSLTAQDLVPGTVNKGDSRSMVDVLPMQRRHSLFATGRQGRR